MLLKFKFYSSFHYDDLVGCHNFVAKIEFYHIREQKKVTVLISKCKFNLLILYVMQFLNYPSIFKKFYFINLILLYCDWIIYL